MYNYSYSADVICAAVGGMITKSSSRPVCTCAIHSDKVCNNALFVAIGGTHTDGHCYIQDAICRGASCIFYTPSCLPSALPDGDYTAIAVDDTVRALGAFAAYHRLQCHCFVIGVTGSVGKTTTKQFLYAIFSQVARTVATHENYNNELGVPLTLLSISQDDAYAIVEMGMSDLGEISYLSRMVQPDIAVITNIGTAHLGKLGSRAKIAQAKLEILDGLRTGGKFVIDGDEPLLSHLPNAVTVSRGNCHCDYAMTDYQSCGDYITFSIHHDATSSPCTLFAYGNHTAYDASLAFAVAKEAGICGRIAVEGLRHFQPCAMRQVLRPFGSYLLFEDCYNASYESVLSAIETVCSYAKGNGNRPIAILGDMLELGDSSSTMHRSVGRLAAQCGMDALFAFGQFATDTANGFSDIAPNRICVTFPVLDYQAQGRTVKRFLKENDLILLKGSRAMHLEQLLPHLQPSSL